MGTHTSRPQRWSSSPNREKLGARATGPSAGRARRGLRRPTCSVPRALHLPHGHGALRPLASAEENSVGTGLLAEGLRALVRAGVPFWNRSGGAGHVLVASLHARAGCLLPSRGEQLDSSSELLHRRGCLIPATKRPIWLC
jgi:hypothetical protein